MKYFAAQYKLECRMIWRSPQGLASLVTTAILLLSLLQFGFPSDSDTTLLLPPLLLAALTLCMLHQSAYAFMHDTEHDRIAHWQSARLALEWMICAKLLAAISLYALPLSAVLSVIMALVDVKSIEMGHIFTVFSTSSIAIIACGLITSAIQSRFAMQPLLHYVLALPALSSTMIFASESLHHNGDALLILACISAILCIISAIGSALILRQ